MTKGSPRHNSRPAVMFLAVISLAAGLTGTASGELKGPLAGWKATAELSFVLTGGNQSTSAFSLGTTFSRAWKKDSLLFKTYILRSRSVTIDRSAVGTETDYEVFEEKTRRLVAENYILSGQYERKISKRFLMQTSLSWDRNRFAGIESRFIVTAGTGYAAVETEKTQLKMNTSLTYTLRKFLVQNSTSFTGIRLDLLFDQKLSKTSSFTSQFVLDENLKKTSDWRYDWTNSLTASVNKSLALKTSLRLLYSHMPATEAIPLFSPDGIYTGLTVLTPLRNLDKFFTTSLVINF